MINNLNGVREVQLQEMCGDELVNIIPFEVFNDEVQIFEDHGMNVVIFECGSDEIIEEYDSNLTHQYFIKTDEDIFRIKTEKVSYDGAGTLKLSFSDEDID